MNTLLRSDLARHISVDGSDRLNLNAASPNVLKCLPEVGIEGYELIVKARAVGHVYASAEDFAEHLPLVARRRFFEMRLSRPSQLTSTSSTFGVEIVGHSDDNSGILASTYAILQLRGDVVELRAVRIE